MSMFEREPKSLCTYFWTLVLVLTLKGIVCSFGIFMVVLALTLLFYVPGWSLFHLQFSELLYISALTWVGAAFVGRSYWLNCTPSGKRYKEKRNIKKDGKKESEPNILLEYLKAVKNKVCPIINYE